MKKITFFLTSLVLLLFSINLLGQDKPETPDKQGCKDYPYISRYTGATIHQCSVIDYGKFYLGLDKPVERDFNGHGQFFNKYLEVEGKIFNIQYLLPQETGVIKVWENYKTTLTKAGYNLLYVENSENPCFYREDYYGGDAMPLVQGVRGFYGNYCEKTYYYSVFKGVRDSLDIYVVIFVADDGDEVIVNQSVIETLPLELGLVKADAIAQNIELTGHSVFYDIHFETGSATIDSKSDNQIKEIANYLKQHTDKKFYIVGHTDNTGNFEANKILSENRAKAVVNELINKYGVDDVQLNAYGVADLCPIASNSDDVGKARNRRVEIVEQ